MECRPLKLIGFFNTFLEKIVFPILSNTLFFYFVKNSSWNLQKAIVSNHGKGEKEFSGL
jgi:hypothetical protein